jgi:hypothetical protein
MAALEDRLPFRVGIKSLRFEKIRIDEAGEQHPKEVLFGAGRAAQDPLPLKDRTTFAGCFDIKHRRLADPPVHRVTQHKRQRSEFTNPPDRSPLIVVAVTSTRRSIVATPGIKACSLP